MSEFKYACPVCGQHIKCDSSQGGAVMDCPTCFQKIVAPMAPAPDSKIVPTGTKLSDKKTAFSGAGPSNTGVPQPKKTQILLVVALLVVAGAAVAGYFIYSSHNTSGAEQRAGGSNAAPVLQAVGSTNIPAVTNVAGAKTNRPAAKPRVAPQASDTNWMLNLEAVVIPRTPVVGRIHSQNFILERASYRDGYLVLRHGTRGQMEFGAVIGLGNVQAEALSGKTINITNGTPKAPRISLRWKEADHSAITAFDKGYAMRLEFGALTNNYLRGKIYLCTPDATKSYLMGTFNADARKPDPKPQG